MHHARPLAAVASLLLTAACTPPVEEPPDEPARQPRITITTDDPVAPQLLDFGEPLRGETITREVFVENSGPGVVSVRGVWKQGGTPLLIDDAQFPLIVNPGDVQTIPVRWNTTLGDFLGTEIVFETGDTLRPEVGIEVAGQAVWPLGVAMPDELDLGDVEAGCVASAQSSLANIGTADLVVGEFVTSGSSSGTFTIDGLPAPGTTLAPGEEAPYTVTFEVPSGTQSDSHSLSLKYVSPSSPWALDLQYVRARSVGGDGMCD